jgi:hypothetical protein
MDPLRHAALSARRRGGEPADYLALHSFFDTTKELCSDNRHRLLHNAWGIRRVVLPIFGPTLAGDVSTKEVCEHDHVLADFSGRYLPTLGDFAAAIEPERGEEARFEEISSPYDADERELLRSPWAVTGLAASLLATHNTWFLSEILPRIFPRRARPAFPRGVAPGEIFARMRFELWMDNGAEPPPSAPLRVHEGTHVEVHHS